MPLELVRNDITKMKVDAIVNAAKPSLLGGGGVDGAIHRAAGPGLLEECRTLGGCERGQAKITRGYRLPCKYVIHTAGPIYEDGKHGEEQVLASCYRSALALAREYGCETVAFPLISAGVYGYPKDQALRVAVNVLSEAMFETDMTAYIVVYGHDSVETGRKLFADVAEYIDDNYVETHSAFRDRWGIRRLLNRPKGEGNESPSENIFPGDTYRAGESQRFDAQYFIDEEPTRQLASAQKRDRAFGGVAAAAPRSLDDALRQIDESFTQMLLRKIDEKGMTDAECYKKANIDRKLFSKIRSDVHYKPRKSTVLAFAIALELPLSETRDMLAKAGYALSHSNKFDIIVEYYIQKGNYNVFEINEALFSFDQSLLGA